MSNCFKQSSLLISTLKSVPDQNKCEKYYQGCFLIYKCDNLGAK